MTPRIAVFSGPTATIQNSPPLVTSGKARAQHGLPALVAARYILVEDVGLVVQSASARYDAFAGPAQEAALTAD
jgi:hypothetical protein